VTHPVCAVDTSDASIVALSWLLVRTSVRRGDPFQFTTAPEANPVPFTVRVSDDLPGATLAGFRG